MCAETLWWRCHRRLIADLLVARGHGVLHLVRRGETQHHQLGFEGEIRDSRPVPVRLAGRLIGAYDGSVTDAPTFELLSWVSERPRTYAEAIDAWRSHCPRSTVWEDALHAGLIRVAGSRVALTPLGEARLDGWKRQPTPVV